MESYRAIQKDILLLRSLNLCGFKDLKETPNFRFLPSLEGLDLEGCTSLVQQHPSIASLQNLEFLNLKNCTNLRSILGGSEDMEETRDFRLLQSLEKLDMEGCTSLV